MASASIRDQELGSMYDYLAKIILLGPSGTGKSCILHRFVKSEWRVLSSQTIGVEFASKVVKVGSGARRRRIKLQLWDTAGTERFRAVSRSYYRGAAGAILIYDIANHASFRSLSTFLSDARSLGSQNLVVILAGNKCDLTEHPEGDNESIAETITPTPTASSLESRTDYLPTPSQNSLSSTLKIGSKKTATLAQDREVFSSEASRWASSQDIPLALEVSALLGENIDEIFTRLASMILTKIELGEINPDDPASGIQYGDIGWSGAADNASIKSAITLEDGNGRRGRSGWSRDLEQTFRFDAGSRSNRRCC